MTHKKKKNSTLLSDLLVKSSKFFHKQNNHTINQYQRKQIPTSGPSQINNLKLQSLNFQLHLIPNGIITFQNIELTSKVNESNIHAQRINKAIKKKKKSQLTKLHLKN